MARPSVMAFTRRTFLVVSGAVTAGAALDTGGLLLPGAARPAYAEDVPSAPARGVFGGWTTLDRTVRQSQRQDVVKWSDYVKLSEGDGEAHVIRTDLSPGGYGQPTRAIDAFVQITDLQIVDEKSPGRVEFTDRWANLDDRSNTDVDSAYRPQEMLSTQIVEAMTRAIRNAARGPMTGLYLTFTIATGDMVDNVQYNETRWYIDLLDGGHLIQPESAIGSRDSVSDLFSEVSVHDPAYWSPEGLLGGAAAFDRYRFGYGFPIVHGLLPAARKPFTSTGLGMPWYAAMGNHDGEIQGNYPVHPTWVEHHLGELPDISDHATMAKKPLGTGSPLPQHYDTSDVVNFVNDLTFRAVTADASRRFLTSNQFAAEHFTTTGTPLGHGFVKFDSPVGPLYATYYSRPALNAPVQYITLDTVNYDGGANGRIPSDQFKWLEAQLKAHSSRFFDDDGKLVLQAGVTDRLIVLFAHHTIDSIDNGATDQIDVGEIDFYYSKATEKLLLRYPNVIAFVCGHTHRNEVKPYRRGVTTSYGNHVPGIGGFWQISTASHIDWPVQSRIIELAKSRGHISIMTTMIDLAAPVDYAGDLSSPVALASLARELAANDPTERPAGSYTATNADGNGGRRGTGGDRNLQLLVPAPFFIGTPDQWGSSVAVTPDSAGTLRVFGTRADDTIRLRTGNGTDWAVFPAAGTSHAVAAEVNADGRMELFGLGAEQFGRLWHSTQTSAGASTWSAFTSLGDVNARSVAAARNSDGQLEVFVTTAGGDVSHLRQSVAGGSWSSWEQGFGLPYSTFFTAVAAAITQGRIEVFTLSDRGELWRRAQTGTGGWTGWTSMGNLPTTRYTKLAAARHADGRLTLLLVDHDRRVWRTSQTSAGSTTWTGAQLFDVGRTRMTQLAARCDDTGRIAIFGVDHAGQVWLRRQSDQNGDVWTAWTSWGPAGMLRPDVPIVPGSSNTSERVVTPNLTGMSQDAAQIAVAAAGLVQGVIGHEANTAPVGTVFAQSPAAPGQVAFEGDTVNFRVSLGAVTVPDVISWDRASAMRTLTSAGLAPNYSVTPSNLTKDDVLTQNPSGGTVVPPGTAVHLSVASGPTGDGKPL